MTRRNRKKIRKRSVLLPAPLAGVLALLLAGGVGHIWVRSRCEALASDIQKLSTENRTLQQHYTREQSYWSRLKSPGSISQALARHGIRMTQPRGDQVVWVKMKDADSRKMDRLARHTIRYGRGERFARSE